MWSSAFVRALGNRELRLEYRVEVLQVRWGSTGAHDAPGDPSWVAATTQRAVQSGAWARLVRAPVIAGGSLQIRTWAASVGGCTLQLVDADLASALPRGTFLRVLAGQLGQAPSDYEQIWVGQVDQLVWEAGVWTVSCLDLAAALKSRPTRQTLYSQLFYGVGDSTTLTADYAIGDGLLKVASTVGFERETGGKGVVLVTPVTATPFLIVWDGSTATSLTTIEADFHGTSRHAALTGQPVKEVAYLAGHPAFTALKVLTSTGTGANGMYDLLPVSWGLGLPWGMIDLSDTGRVTSAVGGSSADWQILVTDQVEDGFSWLRGLLSLGGFFLTMHQGKLTIRAVEDPSRRTTYDTWTIDEDDLVEDRLSYQPYSEEADVEYADTSIHSATGVDSTTFVLSTETLPLSALMSRDLSELIWTSESPQRLDILGRLQIWDRRIPERLAIETTLRLAPATVGDRVRVVLPQVPSRRGPLSDREGIITATETDWDSGTVSLEIHFPPAE